MLKQIKTVGELIEALKEYKPDMLLVTAGADSGGYDVEYQDTVLLGRFEEHANKDSQPTNADYWPHFKGLLFVGGC